jgi:DUF1680 family protein
MALQGQVPLITLKDNQVQSSVQTITAIPYYAWCNRGSNQMQVWYPTQIKDIKINY